MTTAENTEQVEALFTKRFGGFNLDALLVHLDVDPKDYLDLERIKAFRAGNPGLPEQVEFALAQISLLHEERHLHDAFGTRAGISLFLSWHSVLGDFVRMCEHLASVGRRWVLPVTKADASDLPDEARQFIRHALNVKFICWRFRGVVPSQFASFEGAPDPLPYCSQLKESRLGTMVYAFPARVIRLMPDGEKIPALQHLPLGFDALLEGNAQAIQRTFVEMNWGQEVAQSLLLQTGVTVRKNNVEDYAPLYNITDLMLTRYLESKGIESFPRNALLALTDHALTAGISIRKDPGGFRQVGLECPGHSFVELLQELGPEAIVTGKIPSPKDDGYQQYRDIFASIASFEQVDGELAGPLADIEVLYRWVGREIIVPLLDARLDSHHRVFSDMDEWLSRYLQLPRAPFQTKADGSTTSSAPTRVVEAWLRVRMIESLLSQLIEGDPAILCPRAYGLSPGIGKVNFAHSGSCDEYVTADLCGRYQPGIPGATLPRCQFADTLRALRFL